VANIAIGRLTFTRFSPQLLKMRFFFFWASDHSDLWAIL